MWQVRARSAVVLFLIGACSFPAYSVDAGPGSGCADGIRNGDETGVDCGASCAPCALCSDGLQNGQEAGVDCGGSCPACPTCEDALQNGSESDTDCGGTCSERCDTNQRCRENADCASLVCLSVCQPSDCNDGVRNGLETSVDCGGSGCSGCSIGSACRANADCLDGRCQNEICVNAGCTDEILNGLETDTDCGGPECAPCAAQMKCKSQRDCQSLICTAGEVCSAATCSDATQNQQESSADCGGASCAPCASGKSCFKASDCESSLCRNGTCVPAKPSGKQLSKAKWSMRTSLGASGSSPSLAFDADVDTCWTSGEPQSPGMYVELDLGEPSIFFKAVLRVTAEPYEQDYPGSLDVYVSNDASFGEPTLSAISGSAWTWIDFPSAQVGRYVRFQLAQSAERSWSIGNIDVYN